MPKHEIIHVGHNYYFRKQWRENGKQRSQTLAKYGRNRPSAIPPDLHGTLRGTRQGVELVNGGGLGYLSGGEGP